MAIFQGAGVAIVTPFTKDDQVDLEELGRIIEDQITGGTDAIVICGSTGEAQGLTSEERMRAIRFTVAQTAGRVPVIAGTGTNRTDESCRLSELAKEAGADGILLVTPYYNKPTQAGMIAHFGKIAEAAALPVILYNVPSRTGCNLLPETVVQLAKQCPYIKGIKEASGNLSQMVKLAALSDGLLDLYAGNDDQVVPMLALGGIGVISVASNIAPAMMHEMVWSYLKGDVKRSCRLQLQLQPLVDVLFCESNPIPVKAAMKLQGYKTGMLREPLYHLAEKYREPLRAEMEKLGLLPVQSA